MIAAIRVDAREPKAMHALFAREFGELYTSSMLPTGDIMALVDSEIVLFERKTGSDLLSSIRDNRLIAQASRMVEVTNRAYLLVTSPIVPDVSAKNTAYGLHGEWFVSGFPYVAVQGALLTVQELGVMVMNCTDYGIANVVKRICERAGQPIRVNPNANLIDRKKPDEVFYASLPGIGNKNAEELAKNFPTPVAALSALTDMNSDFDVSGIGKKTREKIIDFLGGVIQEKDATEDS